MVLIPDLKASVIFNETPCDGTIAFECSMGEGSGLLISGLLVEDNPRYML